MINKILVATDASAASNRAVTFAASLSVQHEAELLILNVIRDVQLPQALKEAPEFGAFNNAREDLMRQAAEHTLRWGPAPLFSPARRRVNGAPSVRPATAPVAR